MIDENWVHDYIAAKCKLKDPAYMGVDLWPIFQIIAAKLRIAPVVTTKEIFANTHIRHYNEMSELEALQFLNLT